MMGDGTDVSSAGTGDFYFGEREETFKNKIEFKSEFVRYIDVKHKQLQEEFDSLNKFESMSLGIKYD